MRRNERPSDLPAAKPTEDFGQYVRDVPDFPKKGIMFRDITTLLQDGEAFKQACNELYNRYKNIKIDVVVGIESRGFIFGSVLAYLLGVGFVPVRKPGKLPYKTVSEEYEKEYGKDKIIMHEDSIKKGQKVLLVDDLIATGGTCSAAVRLIEKLGGEIVECAFLIDLPDLKGKEKLKGYKVFTMMEFEGE